MTESRIKRKGVLSAHHEGVINKDLKVNLIISNALILFGLFLVLTLYFYSKMDLSLNNSFAGFVFPLIIILTIFLALSIYVNLYFAFKASAPIYRLQKYFKEVSNKQEVLPLSFRNDDYYTDLPPLIIESYQRLSEKNL